MNWEIIDPNDYILNWKITKKTVTIDDISWNYNEPFVFEEGETYSVTLNNVPTNFLYEIEYTNNTSNVAGTFEATATIIYDSKYYNVSGETTYTLTWVIVDENL